jgi:D-glycero-D-manno-heptose 1,7-bisphosphate phosphatase
MHAAKLALLDRDGTLIDVVRDEEIGVITTAFHPDQLRILPGVVEGLRLLQDQGYELAIVTNQPGPAKGHFSAAAVTRTNAALVEKLSASGIRIAHVGVCMHHPDGGPGGDAALVGPCACRKPKPGLLLDAMRLLGAAPGNTWMIGDSLADVEAARAAGVRSGLLFATPGTRCELCPLRDGPGPIRPDRSAPGFEELIRAILASERP